jgi:hypothetical protein
VGELSQTISTAFAAEYRMRAAELHRWVDPLTEDQFWRNPYSYGNSVGHLVLHLSGNLRYYIGARIAATGYLRNRDLEFTEPGRPAKADVLRGFDETIALVIQTIERQSETDWNLPYAAVGEPEAENRFTALLRCVVHFYHHVGQINYLSRELAKD